MKKILFLMIAPLAISSCSKASDDPMNFVGTWVRQDVAKEGEQNFGIQDRILIESDDGKSFEIAILARGTFAKMAYKPEHGYICAPNNACFGLKDKNTLMVGSESGQTIFYARSDQ